MRFIQLNLLGTVCIRLITLLLLGCDLQRYFLLEIFILLKNKEQIG